MSTNKQKVAALKVARKRIESGLRWYICTALPKTDAGKAPECVVSDRLDGNHTLEGWLYYGGHATWDDIDANPERMRITRLAWIDSLIEEFSK